jgi:hypothetical protein
VSLRRIHPLWENWYRWLSYHFNSWRQIAACIWFVCDTWPSTDNWGFSLCNLLLLPPPLLCSCPRNGSPSELQTPILCIHLLNIF